MRTWYTTIAAVALALALAACGGPPPAGDADANRNDDRLDAAASDAGPDADCVTDPVTSAQLLNACTDAQRIAKTPAIPTTATTGCYFDGTLPSLP